LTAAIIEVPCGNAGASARPPLQWRAMRESRLPSATVTAALAAVAVVAIAYVDGVTGVELRVFPLYFVPVLAVSLRLGRWPGLAMAAVCAAAWYLSNRLAGLHNSPAAIDVANVFVMAIAFGVVALLGAAQRTWLHRERALSRTDGLTGLLNGRGFYEAAAIELARSSRYQHPLTVAYLDVDDFKQINDLRGHARGDAVLVAVARAVRRACRSTDLVARLGGDEFVVLFAETARDAAEAALGKVRSRVREVAGEGGQGITMSVGSVSFVNLPAEVEVLVHEADRAMYAAKALGKDALRCVSYGENQ
jgi:diguanylate cyclase (GGDEF)-like protein